MNGRRRRRGPGGTDAGALAVVLALAVLSISSCSEQEETRPAYKPASLSTPGADGVKTVRLTAEAARRAGLQTSVVVARGRHTHIPYAALVYDTQGKTWVYTVLAPLTYRRVAVAVTDITGNVVTLSAGPVAGTRVATTGATQLYGAERDMAGKH